MNAAPRKLLYVVPLPPPVHGVAQVNRMVVNDVDLNATLQTRVVEVRSSKDLAELDVMSLRKVGDTARLYLRLIGACWSFRPDFAYLSPVPTGPAFLRDLVLICILKVFRVKRILHLHGLGIGRKQSAVWRPIYRLAFADAAVISISAVLEKKELGWLRLPRSRLYVVRNAVADVVHSGRARREASVIRLLFLSATYRSKGMFVLLDAFRALAQRFPRVELEIVGSSNPVVDQEIAAWIETCEMSGRIHQLGSLYDDAKHGAFMRADVFVHPTLRDYFPLVLLEAMSYGLPIVSTRVGAIPEIVADDHNGFLCEPNDTEGLAWAMERLVRDSNLRHRCGEASRKRFEQEFSTTRFSDRMRSVFTAEGVYS